MAEHPIIEDLKRQASASAAMARNAIQAAQAAGGRADAIAQEYLKLQQELSQMRGALARVQIQAQTGDPNIQRIENIPGRRIPFDFVVDIPFNAGSVSATQQTITIDQTGPFIAVARYASFISTYTFSKTDSETGAVTRFNGRSYGRCRPVHSAFDLNDGQPFSCVTMATAFPGTGFPHIASPSNESPWRSMEMDFRIDMREQGSSLPRQNTPILSSLFVKGNGDAFELGALDFFERSQVIQFTVQPMHAANAAFGNISGFTGPGTDWPFIESGWDAVEGISDPAIAVDDDEDPIERNPTGVLEIGFHGFRIIQPPGPGQF